jgi:RNA polymerase sigma-70 factor (ECF subfamily)
VTEREFSDPELSDLARRAARGDARLTERLFLALLPRVRNLVRYLIRGDHDVDDFSQEALLTILRGLESYRGEGEFRAWADRIVARSVFAARKRRSERPTDTECTVGHELNQGSMAPPPDSYCERRQVVAHLDTLPDNQRAVLVLHYVLGMTVPEVSVEIGAPEETVRSRLRLGKDRLRRLMGEPLGRMVG